MAGIANIHDVGPAVFLDNVSATTFKLDGIEDLSVDPAVAEIIEEAGGQVDPSFVAVGTQEPVINFTATELKTALDNIDLDGLKIPTSTTVVTYDQYFTQVVEAGTRGGASAHFKVTVKEGLIVPLELSANHGEKAQLTCTCHSTWDGTNDPLAFSDSVSLPHTPQISEMFTLGKAVINGTAVDSVLGWSLNFGLEVETLGHAGEIWPRRVHILRRRPSLEIQTKDVPSLTSFGLSGAKVSSTTELYLQKMDNTGTRVTAATAQHIKITVAANQARVSVGATGGGKGASGDGVLRITPIAGTSAILALNTASAIT